jgi:RNA polymerase sigma-70 factor (ECF subfamily)
VVGGQREIQSLVKALYELPARRRKILIAARLEEAPHLEISQRFGISTRMVEKEIKAALGHCAKRLERKVIQRFGPGAGKPS